MKARTLEIIDVVEPEVVQVQISDDGRSVWVNVDGICMFRAQRISALFLEDDREAA